MRRSTRENREKRAVAAAAAGEVSTRGTVPKPKCDDDGTFQLLRSNGEIILGRCQDPDFRLSRRPLTSPPEVWYADCNEVEPPHTLRIYRIGTDDKPEAVHLYSFIPEKRTWVIIEPVLKSSREKERKTCLQNASLVPFLTKLLSRFVTLLRWLLGDTDEWYKLGRFRVSRAMPMDPNGQYQITHDPFTPHMLNANGDIFIEGKTYSNKQKIDVKTTNKITHDITVWYFRKRGNLQKLYIFRRDSQGEFVPTVLNYQYGTWWLWEYAGPGSLSDDKRLVGARTADILYVLGIIYMLLYFL